MPENVQKCPEVFTKVLKLRLCDAAFSQQQSLKKVISKKEKGYHATNLLHFAGRYQKNGHYATSDIASWRQKCWN